MSGEDAPLLQAGGLALKAGARTLLSGLSLRVAAGQLWCVLGPNGSGKTTLLHALAGLRAPDAGTVQWRGRDAARWRADDAARFRGLLPQALHDAFGASALDTVLMGRHPHLSRWAWEDEHDRAVAHAALAAVDLDGFAARDVTTLSGGERQRVGIAALLAQQPQLLLLDEPLAHLDLRHQGLVLQHLAALARDAGKAVLLSLHGLDLAHRWATHVLLLRGDGGAPVQGPADEALSEAHLSAAFAHPVRGVQVGARRLFFAE